MKSSAELTIGELAERFGLATHVLRYWESRGLIEPARRAGGQRRYGRDALVRVALILMGKEAGLGLRSLGALLSTPTRWTTGICCAATSPNWSSASRAHAPPRT